MRPLVITTTAGLDSTTLLYRYASLKRRILPFFVDYGQKQAPLVTDLVGKHVSVLRSRGLSVNDLHVHRFDFPSWMVISDKLFKEGYTPSDVGTEQRADDEESRERIGWINCRNLFILSFAAAFAVKHGADLCTGHLAAPGTKDEEEGVITDASLDFVDALEEVLRYSLHRPLTWVTPFCSEECTKREVFDEACALSVPIDLTVSCDYMPPCGTCGACQLGKELGIKQWGHR